MAHRRTTMVLLLLIAGERVAGGCEWVEQLLLCLDVGHACTESITITSSGKSHVP